MEKIQIVSVEEPYVSLKVAKALKENGFVYAENEPTKRMYQQLDGGEEFPAPSYSLVLKWIEVNFFFHIDVTPRSWEEGVVKWSSWADELKEHYFHLSTDNDREDEPYDTKEEALDAAILGVLNNLIPHFQTVYEKIALKKLKKDE